MVRTHIVVQETEDMRIFMYNVLKKIYDKECLTLGRFGIEPERKRNCKELYSILDDLEYYYLNLEHCWEFGDCFMSLRKILRKFVAFRTRPTTEKKQSKSGVR